MSTTIIDANKCKKNTESSYTQRTQQWHKITENKLREIKNSIGLVDSGVNVRVIFVWGYNRKLEKILTYVGTNNY